MNKYSTKSLTMAVNADGIWADWLGLSASVLCMTHCLLVLLITLLPMGMGALGATVQIGLELGERVEWILVGLAAISAVFVASQALRQRNTRWTPYLLLGGAISLLVSRIGESSGIPYAFAPAIVSAALLITGHAINIWGRQTKIL